MFKQVKDGNRSQRGFTLIELLVVAAIIGILLALAIPNLLKARISANQANAAKMMQTLRDAEGEYFEQDLDGDSARNYTDAIGTNAPAQFTLRDPAATGDVLDALVDPSFTNVDINGGAAAGDGTGKGNACAAPRAGYCIVHDSTGAAAQKVAQGWDDFGWKASFTSFNKTGRNNYAVYGDGAIRCEIQGLDGKGVGTPAASGTVGDFAKIDRSFGGCE